MERGEVTGLFVGATEGGPIEERSEVTAVAGQGLEGDRYFAPTPAADHDPSLEITIFEAEAIAEANADDPSLGLEPKDMRRNVMTRGVHLRDLIGMTFKIGEVTVAGLYDNPPCKHLERLTGKPLLKPLIERGGIRGRVVEGGRIRTGDAIFTE